MAAIDIKKARYDAPTPYLTTGNSFADAFAGIPCAAFGTKQFHFAATTNSLDIQILGSIDGGVTYPFTEVASFTVAAAAQATKTVTMFYTHLKVQVKPTVNGANGTLTTKWAMGAPYP